LVELVAMGAEGGALDSGQLEMGKMDLRVFAAPTRCRGKMEL
jgi:hypothetical protein